MSAVEERAGRPARIKEHAHCLYCNTPIERNPDRPFCSEECVKLYDEFVKEQSKMNKIRTLLSSIPLIVAVILLAWALLSR